MAQLLQVAPISIFQINTNIVKSEMTPFSAVSPARFPAVSRAAQVEVSVLETIYEEEIYNVTSASAISTVHDDGDIDDFVETASLLSSSTCFLEVQRRFSASLGRMVISNVPINGL